MINMLLKHRSIRKFKSTPIPEEELREMLEAASRASTCGNMQLYSLIVTRDKAMREKLLPCHFGQQMVVEAPCVVTVCADVHRFSMWCKQRDAEPAYDNFAWFLTATIDALLAAQNLVVAAEARGLGICYLGTTIYNPDPIIDLLQLPELVMPVATITVGYPDECPAQTERLPLEGILHEEVYHDYTPTDIDRIYAAKEAMPENQYFVTVNNKETLAQVFTDICYKKADNEYMSEVLKKTLKQQGFRK